MRWITRRLRIGSLLLLHSSRVTVVVVFLDTQVEPATFAGLMGKCGFVPGAGADVPHAVGAWDFGPSRPGVAIEVRSSTILEAMSD